MSNSQCILGYRLVCDWHPMPSTHASQLWVTWAIFELFWNSDTVWWAAPGCTWEGGCESKGAWDCRCCEESLRTTGVVYARALDCHRMSSFTITDSPRPNVSFFKTSWRKLPAWVLGTIYSKQLHTQKSCLNSLGTQLNLSRGVCVHTHACTHIHTL